MNGILLDKTMSRIIKTLFALALAFCMSCGDIEESSFTREAFENQWWSVESLDMCFTINTVSHKLWYITHSDEHTNLQKPFKYKFKDPNTYSWEGNENFYEGQMDIVDNGDCWDFIYGNSRWETACKCESIPQKTLELTTNYINATHDKKE